MALRATETGAGVRGGTRDRGIDLLRGVAIILMVVDHWAAHEGWGGLWRYSITRASLPLFMFCVGQLVARRGLPSVRRRVEVLGAGALETVILHALGLPLPGPVLLIGALLPVIAVARELPYAIGALGVVQLITFPLPWAGYQPGAVLSMAALAIAVPRWGWVPPRVGEGSPRRAVTRASWVLQAVGRRPLLWYLGHLVTILVVASFEVS